MFENKFNSKKVDPLVEAAKSAMELGQVRRDAIAAVNEEFGVYSRNAVVREHLAAYDARVEEAYKCAMKEGEKMADKDYDGDGKIETSKKEVWGSRLRAAKASGKYKGPVDEKKMWEGSGVSGEDPGMEVAKQAGARQQAQTPPSTPARTGNAAGDTLSKAVREDTLDEVSLKTKISAYRQRSKLNKYPDVHYGDDEQGSDHAERVSGRENKTLQHIGKRHGAKGVEAAEKAASHKKTHHPASWGSDPTSHKARWDLKTKKSGPNKGKLSKSDQEGLKRIHQTKLSKIKGATKPHLPEGYELDEAKYSAKAARHGEDIGKPGKSFKMIAKKAGERYGSEERGKKVAGAILAKIRAKHMKEEESF